MTPRTLEVPAGPAPADPRFDEVVTAYTWAERLLSSMSWILVGVDEQGRITRWNGAAEAAFGIAAAAAVGRALRDVDIGWDAASILALSERCRADETSATLDELSYRRLDGRDGMLRLSAAPIASSVFFIAEDITERKALEAHLAQAQKLESIGQLAAGVAHEMNTPIQFVGDNVRFLQTAFEDLHRLLTAYQRLRDGVPDAARLGELRAMEEAADVGYLLDEIPRALAQTLDGVTRVATIVRALKEFARPDEDEKVPADINHIVTSTLAVVRNETKYVADVVTELGELPPVVCNPWGINQALVNLVVNAAHAVADAVKATGGRGQIRIRTAREADSVLITVSDTGTGIPDAIRSRIFDPFFTTKEVGRGTGQGLAIARTVVVKKHRGALWFDTEVGRGTTFSVRLAIDPA